MTGRWLATLCAVLVWLSGPRVAAAETPAELAPEIAFAAGVVAYLDGEYADAASSFRRVVEVEPDHLRAAHYLGLCLIALEDYEGAVDVLEPASASHPDEQDLRMDLGVAYLLLGNDSFAAHTLGAAVEALPESARAQYYLGATLSRLGDCDLAARHLAEARRLDETYDERSRYLAGMCHARAGDIGEARSELQPLARSPLEDPLADTARRVVGMALRAEGIETERVSLSAATSIQYDSNPSLAPNTAENYNSVAPVFQLDGVIRAVATERHTLAGRVGFYRAFYLPDDHVADYDYTQVAASAYYQLRGALGATRHQLQVGYDFALGLFDGTPPLADENHIYSELHGLRSVWSIRETPDLQTRVSVLVQNRSFAARRRNNTGFTVGVGQTVAVPHAGVQIYVEGTVRVEDAYSLDYDVVAPGALLSVSGRLPWELILSGWALFEHEAHPASSEGRVDEQLTTSLALQRLIIRHLGVTLSWMHNENISTVERFYYRRDVVSLSLWGVL